MLSDKVHLLIQLLYALHVCSSIVCQLYLMAAADALCAPVEITHVYRASHFAGDCMESGLPSFYRLACSFRSEREVYDLACLHLLDYAEDNVAASLSVDRDASKLTEQPSERAPEKLTFHHAVRLAAY